MLKIKELRVEKWLLEQEEDHTCKCGRKKIWFAQKCTDEDCHM